MEKKENIEKTITTEAKLIEVPTQFAQAIQLEDGSIIDERELLLKIYKDIQIIKRILS